MRTDETLSRGNPLGEYLRARREQLPPELAGITAAGYRRVSGLRREEVALLAGVSTDYYTRLEQGRERNPSRQMLNAVARALQLDEEAVTHLLHLTASPGPRRRRGPERVSPALLQLLGALTTPGLVLGRSLDVLALNPSAGALYAAFARTDNLLRMTFLDPAARSFHRDWDEAARASVAALRSAAGRDREDRGLTELVGELSLKSHEFRVLWARHEVHGKSGGSKRFRHPQVGDLDLRYETFTVNSAPEQQLVVYQAAADPASAEGLALLRALAP
ncbi:helix-turn-helix transcriptional regulator [Streptomyces sp. CB01881]|uniref:helix-turn-helix domain-containing protein n=1 Tax=Streptomyces sp. CB01881 TaxID=2078691 RepID=UPI000CDC2CD6|nr:helix-turn-helix transcriptional regulator [Streptomyces sp. CB01881]AUY48275.1 transcriptional regulator [Streptomyces sp. CB01881]TYC76765.1 XRE family transcriptional regulator [Streptomyces sp. CB01881]